MADFAKYVVDGDVKRDKIVSDIQRGRINKEDILEIIQNPNIKATFFGKSNLHKIDKKLWNESYLVELSFAFVAETFCEEYLLYLYEVTQYVTEQKKKKEQKNKMIRSVVIVGIIIAMVFFAVALIVSRVKKDTARYSVSSVALADNIYLCLVKVLS